MRLKGLAVGALNGDVASHPQGTFYGTVLGDLSGLGNLHGQIGLNIGLTGFHGVNIGCGRATLDHGNDLGTNTGFIRLGNHFINVGEAVAAKARIHTQVIIFFHHNSLAAFQFHLTFGMSVGISGFGAVKIKVVMSAVAVGHFFALATAAQRILLF
ncbi:hypothetical protein SDC9_81556 [bioreactor metagenome]|uniref:Uncharacterized protein n=1 Tax=bioreactor metagenome TaxID=1076179 RepID=A0A644Z296_9ZZZZ